MASSAWARPRFYAATLVSELADSGAGMAAAVSSALSNRDPLSLLDSRYGVYAAALAATVAWPAVRAAFTAAVSDVSCVLMKRRGPRFRHALFFSSPAFPHSLSFKKQKKQKNTAARPAGDHPVRRRAARTRGPERQGRQGQRWTRGARCGRRHPHPETVGPPVQVEWCACEETEGRGGPGGGGGFSSSFFYRSTTTPSPFFPHKQKQKQSPPGSWRSTPLS